MEITQNKYRLIRLNDYKSKKMSKTCKKFDFGIEPKVTILQHASRSLLCIRFVAVAFQSEEEVC